MQVARLQRGGGGGWYNKIHDATAAFGMTVVFSRERVLRQYFTIAPYGNRISGAACASRRYFHKPVQDLSLAEAALLASVPKAPSRMNIFQDRGFALAKRRGRLIVQRVFTYGWITSEVRKETLTELATLAQPEKQLRDESCFHYLRACQSKIALQPDNNGVIRTTLDLDLQDSVQNILRMEIPHLLNSEANNAAEIVVDIENGQVLAYVESIDYYDPKGGAIDCAAIPRSTGSLLKPFIYALGMEWQGYTASTVLTDLGFDFGSGNSSFIPENYDRKWIGNTDFTSTKNLSGYEGAARVVKKTLLLLHPNRVDGMSDISFPPPPEYKPIEICKLTGKKADRSTPYITTEYYKSGTEPIDYSTVQQLLPVDKNNGLLAFPGCGVPVEYRRFIVLAPEFRDWAQSQGLEVPPDRYSPACGETPPIDNCSISISSPRTDSRFFIDPEMPVGKSNLTLTCKAFPPPASLLWYVNGEEYKVVYYPFHLSWPMKPGVYEFQAAVPYTTLRSKVIKVEVF
jgi:membrane carboxypeptidase/penicillin-binding protein PbpC